MGSTLMEKLNGRKPRLMLPPNTIVPPTDPEMCGKISCWTLKQASSDRFEAEQVLPLPFPWLLFSPPRCALNLRLKACVLSGNVAANMSQFDPLQVNFRLRSIFKGFRGKWNDFTCCASGKFSRLSIPWFRFRLNFRYPKKQTLFSRWALQWESKSFTCSKEVLTHEFMRSESLFDWNLRARKSYGLHVDSASIIFKVSIKRIRHSVRWKNEW